MFGFGDNHKKEIEALQQAHERKITELNAQFSKERVEIRQKNNTHWEAKIKSTIMNFEKLFTSINENLRSPEARKACIKTFNKIINSTVQNDNLATR